MPSTFTLKYVEIVRLQNCIENSASIFSVAPKVTYGHNDFGACSEYAVQYCALTVTDLELLRDLSLCNLTSWCTASLIDLRNLVVAVLVLHVAAVSARAGS